MKIEIKKSTDKLIGNVRVSAKVYDRIAEIAKREKVSNQAVIRAIFDKVIDDID